MRGEYQDAVGRLARALSPYTRATAGEESARAALGAQMGIADEREITREGVNDDGDIITETDFMLGVDTLGEPAPALRVAGAVYDYGF